MAHVVANVLNYILLGRRSPDINQFCYVQSVNNQLITFLLVLVLHSELV